MTTPAEGLTELRTMAHDGQLDALCDEHHIDLLVAFGSAVAAGRSARSHDLDLAVLLGRRPASRWGLGDLIADLIGVLHLDDIDVLDLGRASVVARSNALGWGEPLYERRSGLFAHEQMAAMGQRMETGWLTDLGLETLARK